MSELNYYTQEGLDKLKQELKHLETVERPQISEQIAEARDKGDLSENAEYDAAKEAQGLLELKISKLKEEIAKARVVDESKMDTSRALILSTVTLENIKNKAKAKYTLVSEKEADLKNGKISVTSPIGKAVLGKSKGDKVEVTTPNGLIEFDLLEITR